MYITAKESEDFNKMTYTTPLNMSIVFNKYDAYTKLILMKEFLSSTNLGISFSTNVAKCAKESSFRKIGAVVIVRVSISAK